LDIFHYFVLSLIEMNRRNNFIQAIFFAEEEPVLHEEHVPVPEPGPGPLLDSV